VAAGLGENAAAEVGLTGRRAGERGPVAACGVEDTAVDRYDRNGARS
jgi:hypothetical protein